jgi:hypothetical protein
MREDERAEGEGQLLLPHVTLHCGNTWDTYMVKQDSRDEHLVASDQQVKGNPSSN